MKIAMPKSNRSNDLLLTNGSMMVRNKQVVAIQIRQKEAPASLMEAKNVTPMNGYDATDQTKLQNQVFRHNP